MPSRSITVGTSPTPLLSYNNKRTTASFFNNGTAAILVSQDESSIVAEGYVIAAGGALDLLRALGDEPQSLWFAQVDSGSEDMRILEQFGELPELFRPPALPSLAGVQV